MDLDAPTLAALEMIAAADRAWLDAGAIAPGALAALEAAHLAERWAKLSAVCLSPYGLALAGKVVRERWAVEEQVGPKGKVTRTSAVVPWYADPGTPDIPAEPLRWSMGAGLALPEMLVDKALGPLDQLILEEEIVLRLSDLAGATGAELDEPVRLFGMEVPREKPRCRRTG